MDLGKLYENMFSPRELLERQKLWAVLCSDWFQKYINETDTVLDLGAGSCEFINNIRCVSKIAVDTGKHMRARAAEGVRVISSSADHIDEIESESVNVVFTSNFLEHLPDKEKLLETLNEVKRILKPQGRFLILSPNIAYAPGRYWDDFGHHIPLSHVSMADCLRLCGFEIKEIRPKFLPFTTRSKIPKSPIFVKWYLKLRPLHLLMGKQMFLYAEKE
jgi:ubiquinone/menaquinone biosynthesis C-methylase UbiE